MHFTERSQTCCGSASGFLGWGCGCCNCKSNCDFDITVNDVYDFCGTTYGDKFSNTNCGCALQTYGKTLPGNRYNPFNVQCKYKKSKTIKFKNCGLPPDVPSNPQPNVG